MRVDLEAGCNRGIDARHRLKAAAKSVWLPLKLASDKNTCSDWSFNNSHLTAFCEKRPLDCNTRFLPAAVVITDRIVQSRGILCLRWNLAWVLCESMPLYMSAISSPTIQCLYFVCKRYILSHTLGLIPSC